MGNKRLIFAIIVVIFLIAGIVGGYLYVQDNSNQADKLQKEMSVLLEKNLLNDEFDTIIKTSGNYGIVEKAVKDYLSSVKSLYTKVQEFCTDSEVANILSAENLENDDEELTVVTQKVSEYKSKLQEFKVNTEDITSQIKIMDAIEDTGVKQNYVDVYKNIMENEALQSKFTNAQTIIESEIDKAETRIKGLEKVVEFLKDNSNYWEVNEGKLQFTNVNKLSQYYQLLNGD